MEFKQELDKETKTLFKITKGNNVIRLNWEELKQLLASIKDTCSDLYDDLRQTYGKKVDKRLSRAALETLSIVAYSQPITRKEIDNIRGVTSDTIVRLLRDREYIKIVGRKDVQGHPCLYGTSRKFLFEFGLQSISDLPKLSDIDRMRFDKGEGEDK